MKVAAEGSDGSSFFLHVVFRHKATFPTRSYAYAHAGQHPTDHITNIDEEY